MTPEQRAERVHHHMYDTCEGIAEHAERIVALEELVDYMLTNDMDQHWTDAYKRARELDVPVEVD